jgi:hypothetical protein
VRSVRSILGSGFSLEIAIEKVEIWNFKTLEEPLEKFQNTRGTSGETPHVEKTKW